jgi:ATP-binding cassette subfamily B (MDR/TAP) protein 1
MHIPEGKFTAIVGLSGSGKSTIIQLLERFYDPIEGEILLDGHNIKDLNVKFLRSCMGLVSQEPTLFGLTVFENVCHG